MPFAYYSRLSKRDQAIYRQSAQLVQIPLKRVMSVIPHVDALKAAHANANRAEIQRQAQGLADEVLKQLGVCALGVRVLAVRPSSARSELHGLYERTSGQRALIRVWMRTAVQKRVVSFRTFVRILMHELCHHLDYELFKLPDSFHTEGFFKRESHLMRQLCVRSTKKTSQPLGADYSLPPEPLVPLLIRMGQ
ncbi:MAG: hypothetical protein H6714_00260 [Myxococcales bacterium]|nr:hypothetical protein [Myxococcales bacterium]